jgi:gluconokinase
MAPASDSPQQPGQDGHTKRWVVMGVSGSGKSTIGAALAHTLGVPFIEGDAFHPDRNVAKMSAGVPLNDDDRADWLKALAHEIATAHARGSGIVVSCSALKRRYRDVLRAAAPGVRFAHLRGERETIAGRMESRVGHYMPPALLDSQLRDLEPLQDGEAGVTLDITLDPKALVARINATEDTPG